MIVDETIGILRVVAEDVEGVTVISVQSVLGAEPHKAPLILSDTLYYGLREALL